MVKSSSSTDLNKYLNRLSTNDEGGLPLPARESPISGGTTPSNEGSYFRPGTLSRTTSTFSFSRAAFSTQLASLTSLNLPKADTLASSVAAIPTAAKAVKSLAAAAQQIQRWTNKAEKVLKDLDAQDDIEWASAAGRDGLEETDKCVTNFERLVMVYVQAIEELQTRPDIGKVPEHEFIAVVEQMEATLDGWERVRDGLKTIRDQVETSMEWEELWNVVLGDVGQEMEELSRLIFEMEEKRHMVTHSQKEDEGAHLNLNELESIVERDPANVQALVNNRFSLPPAFASSPLTSPNSEQWAAGGQDLAAEGHDDSNLLALFARMQPLRASLDFLPMRLSMFATRAKAVFPSACNELEDKRKKLEDGWNDLAKEAEVLRRELSEDRWVLVFRNAGRQAEKMCESVERSIAKLQEGIDSGMQHNNPSSFANRLEGFQAKKMHYGPAIDRVIAIIRKGLNDRLTVNGEILRLHSDMSRRAANVNADVQAMVNTLEDLDADRNSQLRDSISTVVSMDRSVSGNTAIETPGSSPASSVILTGIKNGSRARTSSNFGRPGMKSKSHPPVSSQNMRHASNTEGRRPTTPSSLPRLIASPAPGAASVYRQGLYTPPTNPLPQRPSATPVVNKPRWTSSGNPNDGRGARDSNYRSLSSMMFPNSKKASSSHLPLSSPLSREDSSSPGPTPHVSQDRSRQHLGSFRDRVGSPSPGRSTSSSLLDPVPYHRGRNTTAPLPNTIRSPSSTAVHYDGKPTMSSSYQSHIRPPSALGQSYTAGKSSIPQRTTSDLPRSPPKTDDSGIDMHHDEFDEDEEDENDVDTELGSSPLARSKMAQRPDTHHGTPPSAKANKRVSMLPVPARGASSGRGSVLGNR